MHEEIKNYLQFYSFTFFYFFLDSIIFNIDIQYILYRYRYSNNYQIYSKKDRLNLLTFIRKKTEVTYLFYLDFNFSILLSRYLSTSSTKF